MASCKFASLDSRAVAATATARRLQPTKLKRDRQFIAVLEEKAAVRVALRAGLNMVRAPCMYKHVESHKWTAKVIKLRVFTV